jgi:hypothetical protein
MDNFSIGAHFIHRRHDGTEVIKRTVQVAREDKRWHFYAMGRPLEQENLAEYDPKRKRDRLNERSLLSLLSRLGAEPWSDDFALSEQETFFIRRLSAPPSVIRRSRQEILL